MSKLKIGDYVELMNDANYSITKKGDKGTIVNIIADTPIRNAYVYWDRYKVRMYVDLSDLRRASNYKLMLMDILGL